MSPLLKKIAFLVILVSTQTLLFAQDTTPPPPQRTPPVGLPLPIDENVLLLLAAGLILGVIYVVKSKKSINIPK